MPNLCTWDVSRSWSTRVVSGFRDNWFSLTRWLPLWPQAGSLAANLYTFSGRSTLPSGAGSLGNSHEVAHPSFAHQQWQHSAQTLERTLRGTIGMLREHGCDIREEACRKLGHQIPPWLLDLPPPSANNIIGDNRLCVACFLSITDVGALYNTNTFY